MKKNYTDSDIQKLLEDLSALVPEIDPNDSEWGSFLREFISARPDVQLDEAFAKEVRHRILERAETLKTKKRGVLPQWMKFSGIFVAGAAVCAAVIVPILQTPEVVQMNTAENMAPNLSMLSGGAPASDGVAPRMMKSLQFDDAEEIQEFEIAPMMAQEMAVPAMLRSTSAPEVEEWMAASGILNSEVGEVMMLTIDGTELTILEGENQEIVFPLLRWGDVHDEEILQVAQKFFDAHEFDESKFDKPYINKIWETLDMDLEFPPEQFPVEFLSVDKKERLTLNVSPRFMRVMWMTYFITEEKQKNLSYPMKEGMPPPNMMNQIELKWKDIASDGMLLKVATDFFEQHNFDKLGLKHPRIDRWWTNMDGASRPKFAPTQTSVMFVSDHERSRMHINMDSQTLRILNVSYAMSF